MRGKIYGLLSITMPLGYIIGMVLAMILGGTLGWRGVFYLTGSLGVVLAVVIFFGVREAPRGGSEPEMDGLEESTRYRFDWHEARDLFRKPSLRLLFVQGFFGVFPWNVITYWFFRYLEKERGFSSTTVLITMVLAVLVLAAGYPLGGALGDLFFRRTPRGRLIVSTVAVLIGAVLMTITMSVPVQNQIPFMVLLALTALFIPIASPNVISTVYDVTLPEVRSTAQAIQSFIESAGSALAPVIAGVIAMRWSLHDAILWICLSTWILCAIFFAVAAYLVPRDVQTLRGQMQERAARERALQERQPAQA